MSTSARAPVLLLCMVRSLFGALQCADAVSFVYRSGNQLYSEGKPFYHMGFNAYWMPAAASFGFHSRVDSVLDAAQRLGLRTVRTWGFNEAFPFSPGKYNEVQGKGLDYVIAGAGRRGIRVELAIANFWPAYLGPETWLTWADGSAAGKTVADLYRSPRALQLLQGHIRYITSRVNTLTGVAYKDDPTVIGYNLFNEPRCPGCTSDDMAARNAFISALAGTLRAAAPSQLTFSGTEGFFRPGDANAAFNPGAGTQCDGEDWTSEIQMFDVATTHIYYRQMEQLASNNWQRPSFDFYVQYLHKKLQLYTDVAGSAGRPLVVEEFGLTKRFYGTEEAKVVVALVADALIAAKRAGKPLMAAWLWQAAPPGEPDVGGYDVYMTRSPSGATICLGNTFAGVKAAGNTTLPTSSASGTTSSTGVVSAKSAATGRRLAQVVVKQGEDVLDSFRRGSQRGACANNAAYGWRMASMPQQVDVARYRAMVAGHDIVDILAEAARLLNT